MSKHWVSECVKRVRRARESEKNRFLNDLFRLWPVYQLYDISISISISIAMFVLFFVVVRCFWAWFESYYKVTHNIIENNPKSTCTLWAKTRKEGKTSTFTSLPPPLIHTYHRYVYFPTVGPTILHFSAKRTLAHSVCMPVPVHWK